MSSTTSGVAVHADPERLGDAFRRDVVVGRPDPAGGDHVVEGRAALVHRIDDLRAVVGHDADLAQPDAERFQPLGEIVDVLVLGAPGKDLVADNHDTGGDDSLFGHWNSRAARPGGILRGRREPNHPRHAGERAGPFAPARRINGSMTDRWGSSERVREPVPHVPIHGADAFAAMRRAGRLAAEVLDFITPHVVPGATTGALDELCHGFILDHDAVPAPLNYRGFPKSICTSVNHVVCHGIPGDKVLKDGDIVNIDITVILDGWHGDTSRMFPVGRAGVKASRLMDATYESLMRGIEAVRPGATLGDIGHAIQSFVEGERYSVVRDFCGHGLGRIFHCPPSVLHYGRPGDGMKLAEGMFFTIEPMVNAGRYETKILSDGWTAVTKDPLAVGPVRAFARRNRRRLRNLHAFSRGAAQAALRVNARQNGTGGTR